MRHDIIALEAIPRDPKKLTAVLNEARHQRYWGNIRRWAALNIVAWGLIISLGGASAWTGKPAPAPIHPIYIPIVER